MSISKEVRRKLDEIKVPESASNQAALDEAERLADLYSNIKVVPFRVPLERFIGMSFKTDDETELFA
jgi:hypothetical protein